MNYFEQYEAKKCTPEQAISLIKNDDVLFTGGEPTDLLKALYNARDRFQGLQLHSMFGIMGPAGSYVNSPDLIGKVHFTANVLKFNEEGAWKNGNVEQRLVHFSEMEDLVEKRIRPTVLLTQCSPMQEDGYFYMGSHAGCARPAVDGGAKVIMQVNPNLPVIFSDYYRIHIHEVSAIVEVDTPISQPDLVARGPSEKDKIIAGYVTELIPDGSTIQLGAGATPDAVGVFLDQHHDLGIHTEAFTSCYSKLIACGAVNNSKKELMRGISVGGFFGGSKDDPIIHKNPKVMMKKLAWINDPMTICRISNMMSINSCLGVDLRGQVCSESIGMSITGGIGGQLDFVRGARRSNGGKSFIVMKSTVEKKDGTRLSKITTTLPAGSVVSTPRSDVMYVVTEYGVAALQYKSIKERVEALIAIAHPDFRDELRFDAKKAGWI